MKPQTEMAQKAYTILEAFTAVSSSGSLHDALSAGGLLPSLEPRALLRPERTLRTCASSSGTSPPMMAQSASPLATALQARRDCSTIRCTATCAHVPRLGHCEVSVIILLRVEYL